MLHISSAVAQKVVGTHGLEVDELRHAVECVSGLVAAWDTSPTRGRRAIVEVSVRGQRVLVVLYPTPADPDEYHLGSAYRLHE